jgi:hypothetical protein
MSLVSFAGFKGSERRRVGHGSEKAKPNSPGVGLCVKTLCPMGCTHKVGEIACLLERIPLDADQRP